MTFHTIYFILITILFLSSSCSAQNDNKTVLNIKYCTNYVWRDDIADFQALQSTTTYTTKNEKWQFDIVTSMELYYKSNDIEITPGIRHIYTSEKNIRFSSGLWYYFVGDIGGEDPTITFEAYEEINFMAFFLNPIFTLYLSDIGEGYTTIYFSQSLASKKENEPYVYTLLGYRFGGIQLRNGFREIVLGVGYPLRIKKNTILLDGSVVLLPSEITNKTHFTLGISMNL